MASQSPNVLFLIVDDLRPELGCYGRAHMHTPNIDALAQRSMRFDRHYCQQAICTPSRQHIMTGLHAETTGVYDLETRLRDRLPDVLTLPQHFRNCGYTTLSIGKVYHHAAKEDPIGWSEPPLRPNGREVGRGYVTAEAIRLMEQRMEELRAEGSPVKGLGPAYEVSDADDSAYADHATAIEAVAAMNRLKDKPFFLAAGFTKPHLPFCAPKPYWDLYDPADITVPAETAPSGANRFSLANFGELRNYWGIPRDTNPLPEDLSRTLIHGYRACVSFLDAQIGMVLRELDRLGLRENTVVVLCVDHGFKLGEHGSWCKHSVFEVDTRIPLLISPPGFSGVSTDRLSENVDIFPTLCDLCDLPPPPGVEGVSLRPVMNDPTQPWKRAAFSQYLRLLETMGSALRTDRFRYVEWTNRSSGQTLARELYDHSVDPGENINVAEEPAHSETVAALSAQLRAGWRAALP